jgi:outer membrane receptor for ferrienterochelin and colicin
MVNHKNTYGDNNWVEATGYHRRHKDVYTFDRFTSVSNTIHSNKVSAIAIAGGHTITPEILTLNYSAQITADEVSSVKLSTAPFQSRTYYKLSILPEYRVSLAEKQQLILSLGGSFDDTNRNDSEYSPIVEIKWSETLENGGSNSIFLSYVESTQLIGYNGIAPGGTYFGGDADIKRENSSNLELGTQISRADWSFEGAVFYRWDDNLVDWVFLKASPNTRLATNVDIDTFGIELIASKRWENVETIVSYTYLDKGEDYGDVVGASSFYALNYAKHRFTLGGIWRPCEILEIRIDNEWRENKDNNIRRGSDSALFTHFGLSIYPPQVDNMELFFAVDNAWDDDFEDVPGTPGRGDQYSAGVTFSW